MRTNIEIEDQLMKQAMLISGAKTKKGAVETALRLMIKIRGQSAIRELRGKVHWEGDLHKSRLSHGEE